jgi:hypothetical protein
MKKNKVKKVMGEYKRGTLKSSSGAKVKSRKQAVAIAMSEAGKSKKVPKGYHRMPDGKLMKGSKHKGKY